MSGGFCFSPRISFLLDFFCIEQIIHSERWGSHGFKNVKILLNWSLTDNWSLADKWSLTLNWSLTENWSLTPERDPNCV